MIKSNDYDKDDYYECNDEIRFDSEEQTLEYDG